jgi:hypothetical protein
MEAILGERFRAQTGRREQGIEHEMETGEKTPIEQYESTR